MTEHLAMPKSVGIRERTDVIEEHNGMSPRRMTGTSGDRFGVQFATSRHHPDGTSIGILERRKK